MDKYTLINIKANLNSCLSIGVNPGVNKLIELSITRIDEMIQETERINNGICTIDECNTPYDDDDTGWTVCNKHLKEMANL